MTGDRGGHNNTREETLRKATDTVLAREHYVSPAIFELERVRVFARQWTLAGHISDIPKTGDYFLHQFSGETIIVVREKEDRVVAHLNVCRHRGFAICDKSRGNARAFTCPYHHWNYRLDGSLQRAPGMANGTCIDYANLGLHRVPVEVWAGMIFVWIGLDAPPSLVAKIGEPPSNLRQLDPARIKEAFRETLHIRNSARSWISMHRTGRRKAGRTNTW
jgi:Rieske 2Fe-2S family protein